MNNCFHLLKFYQSLKFERISSLSSEGNISCIGLPDLTLGIILSNHDLDVLIWCRSEDEAVRLNKHRENRQFLPQVPFPDRLQATSSKKSLSKADLVLLGFDRAPCDS